MGSHHCATLFRGPISNPLRPPSPNWGLIAQVLTGTPTPYVVKVIILKDAVHTETDTEDTALSKNGSP